MPNLLDGDLRLHNRNESGHDGMRIGNVTHISSTGELFVDFPGNSASPVKAHILNNSHFDLRVDDRVLLAFESEDPWLPIVLGSVVSRLPVQERGHQIEVAGDPSVKKEAVIDGKTISLTGREEIVLRCGKSSISLKKDGKILVKGTHVVSHASRTNKIKGSAVAIN